MRATVNFLALAVLVTAMPAYGQSQWSGPLLVDLNTGPAPATPRNLVHAGGVLYFRANQRLWASSWPGGDTRLLDGIAYAVERDDFQLRPVAAAGDRVLIRNSGLLIGTTAGSDDYQILREGGWGFDVVGALGSDILFTERYDGGSVLRITDGTLEGTRQISTSRAPGTVGQVAVGQAGGIFLRRDDDGRQHLWAFGDSNDEAQYVGLAEGAESIALAGELPILAGLMAGEPALWTLDSSTGRSETLASLPSEAVSLGTLGDRVIAWAGDSDSLWVTSGTRDGTGSFARLPNGSDLRWMDQSGGSLYFTYHTSEAGEELWRTNGSQDGTYLLKDINPGAADSRPEALFVDDNWAFFAAQSAAEGRELWISDGTPAGTRLIDLMPGPESGAPIEVVRAPEGVFVAAERSGHGSRVLHFSPTSNEFTKVSSPAEEASASSLPTELTAVGSKLFFSAWDGTSRGVYVSDGSEAGTVRYDAWQPTDTTDTSFLTKEATLIAVETGYANSDSYLWRLEDQPRLLASGPGGHVRTVVLGDRVLVRFQGDVYGGLAEAGGMEALHLSQDPTWGPMVAGETIAYFQPDKGGPWYASDGTPVNTRPLMGTDSESVYAAAAIGDQLLTIESRDGRHGLWLLDARTQEPPKLLQGFCCSGWVMLELPGKVLAYRASDRALEPWISDGTVDGTRRLRDTPPAGFDADYSRASVGGRAYIGAMPSSLWATDGSTPHEMLAQGVGGYGVRIVGSLDEELLFSIDDGVHGRELWVTEGNSARLFSDIVPGPGSSDPREAVRVGDRLFVSATLPESGNELLVFRLRLPDPSPSDRIPTPSLSLSEAYPSPASGQVHLDVRARATSRFRVYDLLGRQVSDDVIEPTGDNWSQISIPTGDLVPGLYFLRAEAEGRVEVRSFVVAR